MPRRVVGATHCIHGHLLCEDNIFVVKKGVNKGVRRCKLCKKVNDRNRYFRHKKETDERAHRWHKENPERSKIIMRRYALKPLGWTPELFDKTLAKQKRKCAVCGKSFTTTKHTHADHKHSKPPQPRGILCMNCNYGLGNFKDDPKLLAKAISYLRKYL
jgi:hypothetical protein